MPYIDPDLRKASLKTQWSSGELAFKLQRVVHKYLDLHGMSYEILSETIRALDMVQDEVKRRYLWPYEDYKRQINGDIAPFVAQNISQNIPHPDVEDPS